MRCTLSHRSAAAWLAAAAAVALDAPPPLAADATFHHRGTPILDGVNGAGEWTGALAGSVPVIFPPSLGGASGTVTFYLMNDDTNLYLGVEVPYATSPPAPGQILAGDDAWVGSSNPCAGTTLVDEHLVGSQDGGLLYSDAFFVNCDPAAQDMADGGTTDGEGVWGLAGGLTFFEAAQPLDDTDDGHDLNAAPGERIQVLVAGAGCDDGGCGQPANLQLTVFLEPANFVFLGDFEGGDSSEWSATVP